jgi:hypothetical protein
VFIEPLELIPETQSEFNKRLSIGATQHVATRLRQLVISDYDTRIAKRGGERLDPLLQLLKLLPETLYDNQCWLITNNQRQDNYIRVGGHNNNARGHCISFSRYYNYQPPKGIVIRHRCDNRNCVNPLHLQLGTSKHNSKDTMCRTGNLNGKGAKITEQTARIIRDLLNHDYHPESIAYQLEVPLNTVRNIKYKKAWQWLT